MDINIGASLTQVLRIEDSSQVGHARRTARQLAEQLGFDENDAGRVALVTTELASNLLKHILHRTIILDSENGFITSLPGKTSDNHVQGFRRISGKDEVIRRTMYDIGYEFTHRFAVGKLRRPHVIGTLIIHIPNMLNVFLQRGFGKNIVIAIL